MGPLSAVAVSIFLVILGLNWVTWITAAPKALGVFALVAAGLVLIDTFLVRSGRWRIGRRAAPPAQ
jgi:hypothetical protein